MRASRIYRTLGCPIRIPESTPCRLDVGATFRSALCGAGVSPAQKPRTSKFRDRDLYRRLMRNALREGIQYSNANIRC
jgi:hypothetical protein